MGFIVRMKNSRKKVGGVRLLSDSVNAAEKEISKEFAKVVDKAMVDAINPSNPDVEKIEVTSFGDSGRRFVDRSGNYVSSSSGYYGFATSGSFPIPNVSSAYLTPGASYSIGFDAARNLRDISRVEVSGNGGVEPLKIEVMKFPSIRRKFDFGDKKEGE